MSLELWDWVVKCCWHWQESGKLMGRLNFHKVIANWDLALFGFSVKNNKLLKQKYPVGNWRNKLEIKRFFRPQNMHLWITQSGVIINEAMGLNWKAYRENSFQSLILGGWPNFSSTQRLCVTYTLICSWKPHYEYELPQQQLEIVYLTKNLT